MGIFNLELNYNSKKIAEIQENISNIKGNLGEAKASLYSAFSLINGAVGFNLVEKEGVTIDGSLPENIKNACENQIDAITNSIAEKEAQILAYNDADGFDKKLLFLKLKTLNIKEDAEELLEDAYETGATLLKNATSLAGDLLNAGKELITNLGDNFLDLVDETGAFLISKGESIFKILSTKAGDLKDWLTGFFENNKDSSETIFKKKEEEITDPTIKNIKNNLENTKTSTKDINLDNLKANTRVTNAIDKYSDEIKNADYATISENLFTTTTTVTIANQPVQLTHVVINDPSQLCGAPANGSYASGLETSSSAARRLNSKVLINGSHFSYGDGSQDLKGANYIAIVNGKVVNGGTSGGQELLIDNSGRIFNAYGKDANQLVNEGVKYSFSCHSTQVIENGDTSPSYREGRAYKRTVIGMTEPCEYYIVTDTTSNNILSNTAEYLKDKGCTNAFSLDQGGSVSLVRDENVINNLPDGERAIGDFLYFTD